MCTNSHPTRTRRTSTTLSFCRDVSVTLPICWRSQAFYRRTPGNLGAQILTRDLGDGRTEVVTLSWWESLDSIRAFAGVDVGNAVFYPEDDDYLIERETTVAHYEVQSRS